jgi:hypothetical protein
MVNELRAVVKELGGRTVLGRNLKSQHDLCEAIRTGFPPAVVEQLMQASCLTLKELADALDLSPRSPTAYTVSPGSSPWRNRVSATARVPRAG